MLGSAPGGSVGKVFPCTSSGKHIRVRQGYPQQFVLFSLQKSLRKWSLKRGYGTIWLNTENGTDKNIPSRERLKQKGWGQPALKSKTLGAGDTAE